MGLAKVEKWLYRCGRCNSCKYIYKNYRPSCPSGEKFIFEPYWASGKVWLANAINNGDLEWSDKIREIIFSCPTCGNCMQQCEQDVSEHLIEIFEVLREECVKNYGPTEAARLFKEKTEEFHNPYGESHKNRLTWISNKKFPEKAEVFFFVGCTSSYREIEMARATHDILEKIGINFTISEKEYCCGSPMLRTGQLELREDLAQHNLDLIKNSGAKTVVTSCAGCFRVLKIDYPKIYGDLPFEVKHITEYLNKIKNKIKFKENKIKVTYHDPCHLGRHSGVYNDPRELIQSIPGVELIEMPRNRENAWCCGAGGGVKSTYKDWALEISKERIKEAEALNVSLIVTSCPFCKRNLSDAVQALNSELKVVDTIFFVLENIE
ncbi:MAG: (Fe-S)-binding protein [Candidatus Lokiarchaeota archaeon]|nr:(Fe-S)-binding protein [Candidatus Lokiarchaeota archaeon]